MTIKECIDIVDDLKPNQYSIKVKVMWLSFIDEIIINDVLKTHEGYDGRYDDFTGYSEDKLSVPLIVPSPYDRLYTAYLKMKIDDENGETARYNNSAGLFNSYMMEYRKFYNKTHIPLSGVKSQNAMPQNKPNSGISGTELENIKREVYNALSEDLLKLVSNDKLYDIVYSYVVNNVQMLKGRDGSNGSDGKDGKDAVTDQTYSPTSANAQSGRAIAQAIRKAIGELNKVAKVTLYADSWVGSGRRYTQVVNIEGIPADYTGTVRLTPEQAEGFSGKDVSFMVGNKNGIITVHLIGQLLMNDYEVEIKFEKEERI